MRISGWSSDVCSSDLVETATTEDRYYIRPNYETAKLHFKREPRFYADIGFDGGIWFGQGNYDQENAWHVEGKLGQYSGRARADGHSITRSEEHTSELQSLMRTSYAVICLKKKKKKD